MTPTAVPYPAVAKPPALQWVRTDIAVLDQNGAVGSDPAAEFFILAVDLKGFGRHALLNLRPEVRRDGR